MTVTLRFDEPVSRFVRERARLGGFESEAAFIEAMLETEEMKVRILADESASVRLQRLIKDGMDSGEATDFTYADWSDIRDRAFRRHAEARK